MLMFQVLFLFYKSIVDYSSSSLICQKQSGSAMWVHCSCQFNVLFTLGPLLAFEALHEIL